MQGNLSDAGDTEWSVDDLIALIVRLARALHKVQPSNKLSAQALDYLKRQQLSGSPLRDDFAARELYLHKKTDGVYEVICNASQEATGELLVIYRNTKTGERWARPAAEFNDGRFERLDSNRLN